ncbi:hypothetical protein E4T48_06308 [Aureobasidium sp. EXF-10727]|nr:hypothetical protein E4T48_06308 [Aureobasidium sp. EXF-10727]
MSVVKVKPKPSISDSGYGSVDYTDRHGVEAGPDISLSSLGSAQIQAPEYCEICYEESEKRRYFSNNADRSMLTVKTSKFYYRCAAPSCQKKDKIWPRKDNFKAHLEGTHRYNEVQVAELLVQSECTPDSAQLPCRVVGRQKAKDMKIKTRHRSRKASISDDEDSDYAKSPAENDQHGFENANSWTQRHAQSSAPSASTSYSSELFFQALQPPLLNGRRTHPPTILISDDPEGDMHAQASPIEMMDTSTDFMDDIHSPFLMIGVPSSPEYMEPAPASYSSSTYTNSLFESDMDDAITDTDSDIDSGDCDNTFQPLLRLAVQCLLTAYSPPRQTAPGDSGQQSSNSSHPSSFDDQAGVNGFGASGLPCLPLGSKRRRNVAEEGDGNEDEQPPKRKSKAGRSDEDLPPMACPFVKFDPLKYDKCYTFVLKGVSRVKQHLERVHSIPIHCPKCYSVFRNNTEARDRHVRANTCQTAPERRLEGIDESTMRKLKRRATSRSASESWYSMFALLFPGARKPESPFMDTTLSAELSAFRDFCTHEGHDIVTSLVNANMPPGSYQQDQLADFIRQVFQRSMEELFLQWQSRSHSTASDPTVINHSILPPTPPSTFLQDLNDMGISDTLTVTDEEPFLPGAQQFHELDMAWMNNGAQHDTEAQQQQQQQEHHLQQQWMYFGEVMPLDQGQQFWNDHGVLDGMGGWSG